MRYLQVVVTIACVLMAVMVWQLHGMKPVRYSEIEATMETRGNEAAFKKMQDAPVVRIVK